MKIVRAMAAACALSLAVAACSGGTAATTTSTSTTLAPVATTAAPSTTTTPPTTTTSTTTTTTTTTVVLEPENPSPVNGLDVPDSALSDRRAVAVKIDNHARARPQSGIQEADMVYELLVEAGLTRFIAVFHHSDSTYVGPIRSLRPTDPTLVVHMDAPLQVSGGQTWIISLARGRGLKIIGDDRVSTYRVSSRTAPHNLYGNTEKMRSTADRRGWSDEPPPPIFQFGKPVPALTPATEITLDWSDQPEVVWRWDEASATYLRSNRDQPHEWLSVDGEVSQIGVETLLVLTARRYTASPAAGTGTSVPALDTVGDGEAMLFYGGHMIRGKWQRESIDDEFTLTLRSGATMVVPPGKLWVSIFPTTSRIEWE